MHFFGKKVIPKQRPQDNIKLAINLPQEEDYAVANRCKYSMIHMQTFPFNYKEYYHRFGIFNGITEKELKGWKKIYINELKKATFSAGGKQLVVKTPINTARIDVLLKMFPNAKFIHIHRDPYRVSLSTKRAYRTMFPLYDLQYIATEDELERVQLEVYEALYKKFIKEKPLIPGENYCEIRYNDLIKNPKDTIGGLYETLSIPGFDKALPNIEKFLDSEKSYKTNKYPYDRAFLEKVRERLEFAFDEFGYPKDIPEDTTPKG
jgi:hypothetical protein